MIIKNRDKELEDENPDRHLEWDTLYSEFKDEFHIVYIIYNPAHGKMFIKIGNQMEKKENIKEIISGIELNKENKKYLNICIKIFRQMYVKKNFKL